MTPDLWTVITSCGTAVTAALVYVYKQLHDEMARNRKECHDDRIRLRMIEEFLFAKSGYNTCRENKCDLHKALRPNEGVDNGQA